MKRGGPLARRTPLRATRGFRSRRAPLRASSKEPIAQAKVRIQARIREIVIARDGGCVLRHYPEAGPCACRKSDGSLILQAEHLVTRAASRYYADLRNVVCLCKYHHFFFKKRQGLTYWTLIRRHLGEAHWAWVEAANADRAPHRMDWRAEEAKLAGYPHVDGSGQVA